MGGKLLRRRDILEPNFPYIYFSSNDSFTLKQYQSTKG